MFASFKSILVCGALALAAMAQNINIALPTPLTSVNAGDNITVQVEKPNSLTGSTEVAIAISLKSCSGYPGGCDVVDVSEALGSTLLISQWDPTYHQDAWYPYSNFTVTVPEGFQSGDAILSATHLVLVGAGPFPYTEVVNQTITVA
ncbi:hypothetical protein FOMPIDRAFT_1024642 [Fomitopsis schrenkii]|uniref:Phosphatidylglycerol/phosphatidylinositol transfer protein n=1 Tax=Fomitopsis schrenkii TaxID=2126942 RepID=S8E518_FOMSC|nr:hypothetical protein FOMPIDRAFT_1024642 [Fomitopsis schrenkii]